MASDLSAKPFSPASMTGFADLADHVPTVVAVEEDEDGGRRSGRRQCLESVHGRAFCHRRAQWIMFGNINDRGTIYPQRVISSAIGDSRDTRPYRGHQDSRHPCSPTTMICVVTSAGSGDCRRTTSWRTRQSYLDHGVYTMSFVGSPAIQLSTSARRVRLSGVKLDRGQLAGNAYYSGQDGFYAFDGLNQHKIGAERIDNWFFNNEDDGVDPDYITLTQGAIDTSGNFILWMYPSRNSNGVLDRILVYSWLLDRWSMGRVTTQWASKGISLGYSLDQLDPFGMVDTISPGFNSPVWKGGAPRLYVVNSAGLISTLPATRWQPASRRSKSNSRPAIAAGSPVPGHWSMAAAHWSAWAPKPIGRRSQLESIGCTELSWRMPAAG